MKSTFRVSPLVIPIIIVIVAVVVPAVAAANVHDESAAPLPQLDYIDAQIDVFMPRLQQFQADYIAANGSYYQALESHSLAPVGSEAADNLDGHPTDQEASLAPLWDDTGLPYEINWSFSVGTYDGPGGSGYVLTVTAIIDGTAWVRSINMGAESHRNADWHMVTEKDGE